MIKLIKNADVYGPQALGKQDVLLCDNKIAAIGQNIDISAQVDSHSAVEVIEAEGKILLPGLVDSLVHITGGGGEGGFATRTPEMQLTDATKGGVTTVIGALGTDATTRTLPDLLAKARGLEEEGLSTYCYTGSYQLPARTITANVNDDIVLIDKFIGVGEVAIADHRSSQPTMQDIAHVASEARVGGMLSGKAGIVSIHVGDSQYQLSLLKEVATQTDIPAQQFYPTHMNRNQSLLDAGVEWTQMGGYIDFTASTNEQFIEEGEIPAAGAVAYGLKQGVPAAQMTMSSDGNASLPVFDEKGQLVGLEVGQVSSLYAAFTEAVLKYKVSICDAISTVTRSPADILRLSHKGRIQVGADADLILAEADSLKIDSVWAKGRRMVEQGQCVVKGTFE
ncbi:beta-aspartyl-peptidase [Saliniradius amylolyticus]|nr:beta-aspartyl-peptidase [Saliniradius amylolyticus]